MIAQGDTLPDIALATPCDGQPVPIRTHDVFAGKRVVLVGVPGAFTPTCSQQHLPGYVERIEDFRARGITVAFVSVNDAFVMAAWGAYAPADVVLLADGNAEFTRSLGLEMDASAYGMGLRSQRYALYAEDGVVKKLFVEAPGEFTVSTADAVLAALENH